MSYLYEDCDCEPDWDEPDGSKPIMHRRTCGMCDFVWASSHCPHDGAQNPCRRCGWIEPGKRTPMQVLGLRAAPQERP